MARKTRAARCGEKDWVLADIPERRNGLDLGGISDETILVRRCHTLSGDSRLHHEPHDEPTQWADRASFSI